MRLGGMPTYAASLVRHGGAAGVAVVVAGLFFDSPTVVVIGLLTIIMSLYAAILTGNRAF